MDRKWSIALGAAAGGALLCVALSVGVVAEEPCCNVKSVNTRTKVVVVTEKATSCTYEFQAKDASDLVGLKVGAAIKVDVTQLRAASGATSSTGQAASSGTVSGGGSGCRGSNVPRDAKTKTLCKQSDGSYKPC